MGKRKAKRNETQPNPWIVTHQADVSRFFRVARSTIHEWRQSGMPGERGRWDLEEIAAWKQARLDRAPQPLEGPIGRQKLELEVLKLDEETRKLRIASDKTEDQLLDAEEVREFCAQRCVHLIDHFHGLPDRVAESVPSELQGPIRQLAHQVVEGVVTELLEMQVGGQSIAESIEELDR